MLGLAVLIPLSAGVFDLSIGAMINMSAIVVSLLQVLDGLADVPSIIAAIIVTTFIGFVDRLPRGEAADQRLHCRPGLGDDHRGLPVIITNESRTLPPTSTAWSILTQQKIFGFEIVFLYLIVLALIAWWRWTTPAWPYIYATAETRRGPPVRVKGGMWVWLSSWRPARRGIAGVLYASQNGLLLMFGASLLLPP